MINENLRHALLSDSNPDDFSPREKLLGQNFWPHCLSGNRLTGHDSRAPQAIWPDEIAAAKKKKALRKTKKKMRQQSRKKK